MAAEKDMTVGDPQKIILNFTIPVFIGNVFQQVYSMADTVIVGKFVGTKALAAVGATGTINFLILGFLLGLTAGFTVLTAQKFGAGDMGEHAENGRKCSNSVLYRSSSHDVGQYAWHALAFDFYEHAGGYF